MSYESISRDMFNDSVEGFLEDNLQEFEYEFCERTIMCCIEFFKKKRHRQQQSQEKGCRMTKWIDVRDRLPDDHQDYLVINDSGRMSVSCCFIPCFVKMKKIWESRDDEYSLGEVTHWMELPGPPKDET